MLLPVVRIMLLSYARFLEKELKKTKNFFNLVSSFCGIIGSMKILVIEDEEGLREALIKTLQDEGYLADGAEDGGIGMDLIETGLYDLVILDIMLPVMDGFEVLRHARSRGLAVPVILLTARTALQDKLNGMDLGADDYLTKPFAMQELLARIRMVLRRGTQETQDRKLRAADLVLDPETYELSREGNARTVRLPATEYQLLEYLMRHAGQILSKEQIIQRVWGFDSEAEYDNVVVYMSFIRRKMQYIRSEAVIRAVNSFEV